DPDALINSKGQMTFVEKWVRGHVIISALGTNMHGITNMQEGTVSSFLDGSFGDRIFKLEYDNAGFSIEHIPRKSYINFQIWLYERDGAIEMRYGPKGVNVGVQYKKIGIYFGDVMGIGIDSSF